MKNTITAAEATSLFNLVTKLWHTNTNAALLNVTAVFFDEEDCETSDFSAATVFCVDIEAENDDATMELRYAMAERLGVHYWDLPVSYEAGTYNFNFDIVAATEPEQKLTANVRGSVEIDGSPWVCVELTTEGKSATCVYTFDGNSWAYASGDTEPAMSAALRKEWKSFNLWALITSTTPITLVSLA